MPGQFRFETGVNDFPVMRFGLRVGLAVGSEKDKIVAVPILVAVMHRVG